MIFSGSAERGLRRDGARGREEEAASEDCERHGSGARVGSPLFEVRGARARRCRPAAAGACACPLSSQRAAAQRKRQRVTADRRGGRAESGQQCRTRGTRLQPGREGARVRKGPRRQPRRDRVPRHPHAAASRRPLRRGLLRGRRRVAPRRGGRRGVSPSARRAPAESYLRGDRILAVATEHGAPARSIPGYGFLSENADFAAACEAAGIAFVGPTPGADPRVRPEARARARSRSEAGVRGCRARASSTSADDAAREAARDRLSGHAEEHGRRRRHRHAPLRRAGASSASAFDGVAHLGRSHFGDARVFLEKFVVRARHVEVQIFGDGKGTVLALGERDCSLQRRNQKVVEETPAPGLSRRDARARWPRPRLRLGQRGELPLRRHRRVRARRRRREEFYFLEVNTRLQVEHGVTELVIGIDLVEWMLRAARPASPTLLPARRPAPRGARDRGARLRREPGRGLPAELGHAHATFAFPTDARCETWIEAGTEVHAVLRSAAREAHRRMAATAPPRSRSSAPRSPRRARRHRDQPRLPARDRRFRRVPQRRSAHDALRSTRFQLRGSGDRGARRPARDQRAGLAGPARHWDVGVPPSGPMDDLASASPTASSATPKAPPALELTLLGPTLRFREPTRDRARRRADARPTLDGAPVPYWQRVRRRGGRRCSRSARIAGPGCRAYLAVRGGFDVPRYLGSRVDLHARRLRRALRPARCAPATCCTIGAHERARHAARPAARRAAPALRRRAGRSACSTARTARPISSPTRTSRRSSRPTGRCTSTRPHRRPPDRPEARNGRARDGGEAGLHPSNIHDNAYAVGAIDFTGDMPIILGPDGPSLGGFVCPATIAEAELWKIGQLKPGDRVRFVPLTQAEAVAARARAGASDRRAARRRAGRADHRARALREPRRAVRALRQRRAGRPSSYRRAGRRLPARRVRADGARSRAALPRARADAARSTSAALPGILDLTPGIRSLQIHYDAERACRRARLLDAARARRARACPTSTTLEVPTRIVHLPLSWDDPATRLAIEKYMQSVRTDAPWCPSNIEFIRRINGLPSDRRRAAHRVRRELSRARARRRLPRRAGRDAARSAPSARHDQVQPRAHLDAGKRRRHRRRVPLHLRHGRARAATSSSAARSRSGTRYRTTRGLRAGQAVAAALLRPDPLLSGRAPRSCCALREASSRAASGLEIETTTFRLGDYQRFLATRQRERSRRSSATQQARVRRRAARAGRRRARISRPTPAPAELEATAGARGAGRRARRRVARPGHRLEDAVAEPGMRVDARRRARRARVDEDGDRGRSARRRRRSSAYRAPKGRAVAAGRGCSSCDATGAPHELGRARDRPRSARGLRAAASDPRRVLAEALAAHRAQRRRDDPAIFVHRSRRAASARARAQRSTRRDRRSLPLFGVPVRGQGQHRRRRRADDRRLPRLRVPARARRAPVVERLEAAGAILRRQDEPRSVRDRASSARARRTARRATAFDARYVSGGSSSGSAVAVARGLVSFALGTDTAGSGRVPAAFNNVVGLQADARPAQHARRRAGVPHRSTASRSSRRRAEDAAAVLAVAARLRRRRSVLARRVPPRSRPTRRSASACFADPARASAADAEAARLTEAAAARLEAIGAERARGRLRRPSSRRRRCSTAGRGSRSATPRSASSSSRAPPDADPTVRAHRPRREGARARSSSTARATGSPSSAAAPRRVRGDRRPPASDGAHDPDPRRRRARPGRRERGARPHQQLREPLRPGGGRRAGGPSRGRPAGRRHAASRRAFAEPWLLPLAGALHRARACPGARPACRCRPPARRASAPQTAASRSRVVGAHLRGQPLHRAARDARGALRVGGPTAPRLPPLRARRQRAAEARHACATRLAEQRSRSRCGRSRPSRSAASSPASRRRSASAPSSSRTAVAYTASCASPQR